MKNLIITTLAAILIFGIYSCDKVEGPYKEEVTVVEKDTVRKSVVMDFTGINCSNCPDGHVVIDDLMENYPGRIIPLAFHVPFLEHIDGYTFNLVSQAGTDFMTDYSFTGIPFGLINTMHDSLIAPLDWESKAVSFVNTDPTSIIEIENTYSNKSLSISVDVTALENINSTIKLVVYITENNIVGPQNNHNVIVEDYVHKHVVRNCLNTIYGEEIATSISADENVTTTFTTTIDDSWDENEVSVIAFIYNANNEIIQAEEKHIVE